MSSILLTAPAAEPLSLAEAREFLRVEHGDDDELIGALIAGARMHVEMQTRRALITQSWRLALDAWPESGRIDVRPAPLQAVIAARLYDAEGEARPLDLQSFVRVLDGTEIAFVPWAMPAPERAFGGIELDLRVGYGDAGVLVPEPLRQAIRLLVAHWYENRAPVAIGHETAALPETVTALIASHRLLSL
jgi:uncharacterized phiE125 gp8 family phage protein